MSDVQIRMYDVGFGDCFFLRFPQGQKILLDCGSVKQHQNAMKDVVESVIALAKDQEPDGKPRIDLVIVSHRHKDHIEGFRYRELWNTVEVKQIWMPWTENPEDPVANTLRLSQERMAVALAETAASLNNDVMAQAAELAITNEKAMDTLWEGFAGAPKREYYDATAGRINPTILPGITIRVLAPTKDMKAMKVQDSDEQSYLSGLNSLMMTAGKEKPAPLFVKSLKSYSSKSMESEPFKYLQLDQPIMDQLANRASESGNAFAALLDNQINNSSLVLLIECGNAKMLFPGDAQWGSWKQILDDPEKKKYLKGLSFFKIAHHGSHNGTPKDVLEHILAVGPKKPKVAISTTETSRWPDIPRKPLLEKLEELNFSVVNSDRPATADPWATYDAGNEVKWIDMVIPT
jgi:beta-lactamase superfamily II metal-dependent hydrolase